MKLNNLTKELLIDLVNKDHSDLSIGKMFDMTGEGVAYRRKKWGILPAQNNRRYLEKIKNSSKEQLCQDYLNMTQEEFSKYYGISKTLWLPYLRQLGIKSKAQYRLEQYPPLNIDQKRLIIGGLLGDGSVSQGNYYYESHCKRQLLYLQKKSKILEPFSLPINYNNPEQPFFKTVRHPVFEEFYKVFYSSDHDGKMIPVDFISKYWDDCILAYWFFDDGNFEEKSQTYWIGNYCPEKLQLESFINFLEQKYGWGFKIRDGVGIYNVCFPASCRDKLVPILLKYATPDLYYKIPEAFLDQDKINEIPFLDESVIRPKFYRIGDDVKKKEIEYILFKRYRSRGFPFLHLTEERKLYYLNQFLKVNPVEKNDIISHNYSGQILCEDFFPNMYSCCRKDHKSPVELWKDDSYLLSLLKNRLKYAALISDSTLRTGIKLSQGSVSNFKPVIGKFLYSLYNTNGKTLDYSAGFGSRMLAAMAGGFEYTGYEPSVETYKNLCEFKIFLERHLSIRALLYNQPFETSIIKEDYYGFAFSSPPYYDYEVYANESTQSIVRYPTYEDWSKNFWEKSIEKCCKSVISDGYFGVCISAFLHKEMIKTTFEKCNQMGFYLYKDYKASFPNVLKQDNRNRFELIFIFSRKNQNLTFNLPSIDLKEPKDRTDDIPEIRLRARHKLTPAQCESIEACFKKSFIQTGELSRNYYKKIGINGLSVHVIEHHYKGWNSFIKTCGISPQYVKEDIKKIIMEYLTKCYENGTVLSFHEYGKLMGKRYCTKMKRLFNAGKSFNHLRQHLFKTAADKSSMEEFLCKISEE